MATFKFDHIHIFTRDPEGTAKWYEHMFGAEILRSMQQGKPRIDLKIDTCMIFLLDVSGDAKTADEPDHPHRGLDHFGFEVKGLDAVCAELKKKGAKFTREPEQIRPGIKIAFIEAPDKVSIEILERWKV